LPCHDRSSLKVKTLRLPAHSCRPVKVATASLGNRRQIVLLAVSDIEQAKQARQGNTLTVLASRQPEEFKLVL